MFKILIFSLVVILGFSTSYCSVNASVNPATGERELVLISTARERRMGRRLDEKIREQFDEPVDPELRQRVKDIGKRIAAGSDRKDLVYHFELLATEEGDFYNAFAAPGGYIYIFEDLVNEFESDDMIAAVLAHEMGHVEARHSIKRLQTSLGMTALMILGGQMSRERGTQQDVSYAIGQLMAAYSREAEKEADELGVRYLERAGYDPEASIRVLRRLRELRMDGPIRRYTYFRSHPYLSERIANLSRHVHGYLDFESYINKPIEEDFFY